MSDKMAEMVAEAQRIPAAHLAGEAIPPMMPSKDFTGMMKSTTALIEAVVQTNLRATRALLRAEHPKAVLELQRQFVREYTAALIQGTMTLVGAIELAAADERGAGPTRPPLPHPDEVRRTGLRHGGGLGGDYTGLAGR